MELSLSTWGNSLGLRIPKSIAGLMGIRRGSKVNLELRKGDLVISPIKKETSLKKLAKNLNLKAMVSKVTPDNRPDVSEFEDEAVGNEVW